MWGGRFEKETDPGFLEFSSSVRFDARLYPFDIRCTRAWADALREAGVLSTEEETSIAWALSDVEAELDSGSFDFQPTDEDVHTAVERRLVELAGAVGGKVRTGRSRNDQVATDMRLFVMDACRGIATGIRGVQKALLDQAESTMGVAIPGHTHLQQAQPVLLAHALLSFAHMLERDISLLAMAKKLADSMPLGSGAIAGTGIAVDRRRLADGMGFTSVSANSIDAVSDRDFVSATLFALAMTMVHLSRLSEQAIIWSSQEFGLLRLDDAWSTGSSMMPQKKNPDGPELIRGKAGRVTGALVAFLTTLKGLPLSYNRDLQEDKEGLFDSLDTVAVCLHVLERTVATMTFDEERAAELVAGGFLTATDLADYLVSKGMGFPEAHRVVGEVVTYCLQKGKDLGSLTAREMSRFSDLLDAGALDWISVEASMARRSAEGGTAPKAVARQLAEAREAVSGDAGVL